MKCAHCQKEILGPQWERTRRERLMAEGVTKNTFCGRECFGLFTRKERPRQERFCKRCGASGLKTRWINVNKQRQRYFFGGYCGKCYQIRVRLGHNNKLANIDFLAKELIKLLKEIKNEKAN